MSAVAIKERPILFKGEMVRAIQNDRKNQTRRLNGLDEINKTPDEYSLHEVFLSSKKLTTAASFSLSGQSLITIHCPYGQPGDRLWVKETWRPALSETHECYSYRADMHYRCGKDIPQPDMNTNGWKPSIFMPRKASRIILEVVNVRVERLQDITEEDAIAEGVPPFDWDDGESLRPIPAFAKLWDSINGKTCPWKSNPWLWIVEFKRIDNAIATQQSGGVA